MRRPIRLRDLADPNFETKFLGSNDARLQRLPAKNGMKLGEYEPVPELPVRLESVKTDFALRSADRNALDLAAYLLVKGELAGNLRGWSNIAKSE